MDLVAKLLYGARGAPAARTPCASWTPAAGPETPWPSSPACCATAAPCRWRPSGWNCIGTGPSRRRRCWTAPWPATCSPPPSPMDAFGVLFLNPPYDFDAEDKRTEHAFLMYTTRYLTEGGLLLFIVPRQRLAVSARYLSSHYRDCGAGRSPTRSGRSSTRWCWRARRKAEPSPDPYAEEQVRAWAFGEPEEFSPEALPGVRPDGDARRGHPLRHPHRGPAGRRGRGPEDRPVGQPGGQGFAMACPGPAHPAPDAPAEGTPGHAGGGGLPRQPGAGGRRPAHPGQGADDEGIGAGRGDGEHRGLPGTAEDHRGRPGPGRRARSPTSPPDPEHIPICKGRLPCR